MALKVVLQQQAATHENEQFRRVVKIMDEVFKKHDFNGILIGNPFNESYQRFRADAILLYDHGVIIIDFKNYSGLVILPSEDEFKNYPWYTENTLNHQFIEIKAGTKFINPYCQLSSYRKAFKEIIENNIILKSKIKSSRVCIANIFSGPIQLKNRVPGSCPYYKIVEESELGELLFDIKNDNAYDEEIDKEITNIFPSNEYIKEYNFGTEIISKKDIIIGNDAKSTIDNFISVDNNDIMILTSMDVCERDNWAKYLFSIANEYNIPEVYGLCHSNRISRRLRSRKIDSTSLYSFIYGGTRKSEDYKDEDPEDDDLALQVVPIASDSSIDDRAMLIVYDAHLVSRSLSQSDLLRFGTGRLLEDFISFANPNSKRKLVFIGDPYMLTYGSSEESAITPSTLEQICEHRKIHYYHQPVNDNENSNKDSLKCSLAKSIDQDLYNNLNYAFNDGSILELKNGEIENIMKKWFCSPFKQEPSQSVLFYKKGDCKKTNLWIKNNCLNNGSELATGDLIIANNNINIPNNTGFCSLEKVMNGMYFTVNDILEHFSEEISIKGCANPITLSFTKISADCLSLKPVNNLDTVNSEIWVLDNYLKAEDDISKEEQVALNVFIKGRINKYKNKFPFINSVYYQQLKCNRTYIELSKEEKDAIEILISNKTSHKEEKVKVSTTSTARSILREHYSQYESFIQKEAIKEDTLVNVLYAKYAWAITVHKAVGTEFDNVILKGLRRENDGICNDSYFRWLYSGINITKNTFYIAHPQYINPFINCVISETNSGINMPKQLLVMDSYTIPQKFADIVNINNTNVAAAICELAKKIENQGYILENVKQCNEYLTKAIFSTQESTLQVTIDIHNKGAKDKYGVSSIRVEPNSTYTEFINDAIESVMTIKDEKADNVNCPDYITDIVNSLTELMKSRNISLGIIANKDYQIVCQASSIDGTAMLRLWYGTSSSNHTKGFINKIEIFNCSDSSIKTKLEDIIALNYK